MGLDSFIAWLLYSSFAGTILTGLILIIRRSFQTRLGGAWQYLLWFLLVWKLLIPYGPESSISLFNAAPILQRLAADALTGNFLTGQSQEGEDRRRPQPTEEATTIIDDDYYFAAGGTFPAVFGSKTGTVFLVWLTGVLSLTAYLTALNLRQKRMIEESRGLNDSCIAGLLTECKQIMDSKDNPGLFESAAIHSPMAAGALRPRILLPAGAARQLSREDLRFIFMHELAHIQRRDLYINWLITALQVIHWFNPVIWYAFRQMRRDRELACDAYVLSRLKAGEYRSYGDAMISCLERYSRTAYAGPAAGLASGREHIRTRVAMIAGYEKSSVAGAVWRSLLFLLIGCLALTTGKGAAGLDRSGSQPNLNQQVVYEELGSYFQDYDGAFVLLDMDAGQYRIYNEEGGKRRVSPDSTYKIVSSLIGLEIGSIDENTRLTWDGTAYPFESWNRDQTLASAMAYSVSWYFQKLDALAGKGTIENYLERIGYGNGDLSGDLSGFWMESSLKISPWEQVEFFRKLYTYEMPFSRKNIDIVKKVIKLSEQGQIALYGKTGTGILNGVGAGWFVGFVENNGKVYIFATNILGKDKADGTAARKITLSILKDKGILKANW